jgi:hypothetical protein
MDEETVVTVTRRWIADVVIGLNLCPFARRPSEAGLVRYAVTDAADEVSLLAALSRELTALAETPRSVVETTLLIHPAAFPDFLDYNDFLGPADDLLRGLRMQGVIQIASFHPRYQFAGTAPDAVENYTNRSPYPMLHLLREDSLTEVASDPERLLDIPRRNIELLRRLGRRDLLARLRAVTEDRPPPG